MALGSGPRRASLLLRLPPPLVPVCDVSSSLGSGPRDREQLSPCELDLAPFHQTKDSPPTPTALCLCLPAREGALLSLLMEAPAGIQPAGKLLSQARRGQGQGAL